MMNDGMALDTKKEMQSIPESEDTSLWIWCFT